MAAAAQVILSGIISAISQPQADNARTNLLRNVDALDYMRDRLFAHSPVEMAQAAETVRVILKEVGIHSTNTQAELPGVFLHGTPVIFSIPGNVDGNSRADARDLLHLGRVGQLLAQIAGRPRPVKDLEART